MSLLDNLWNVSRNLAGSAGSALLAFAEDDQGWSLSKSKPEGIDAESDERGPGGSAPDTPETAPPPQTPASEDPKSLFWDPFAVVQSLGYRDKPSNVTYQTLRNMVWRTPIIQAVIKTRVNQMASFCRPSRDRYDMGFRYIRRGQPKAQLSEGERRWSDQMETILLRTGVTENPRGRDSFETFTRKFMRDSLILDQGCFEVVPDRKGLPAEFYAVDGSTVRLANAYTNYADEDTTDAIRYVQIYEGMVIAEYNQSELCFGVRNPTTEIRLAGYGTSELEMLIHVVTSLLWAWEYNQKAFSQGASAKGIINFKGAIPDKQLKAFRRHWYTSLSGVENSWKTPITNADDLQWIPMQSTNREMEYSAWFDFLIKLTTAIYDMDAAEINFKYGNSGQSRAMGEENNREKINESRDRGLRPLLRYYADCLNRYFIWPINENMELIFVGLDSMTKDEVSSLNQKRVKTTHTIDELRAEDGLPPLPDNKGAVILDPTYLQAANSANAQQGGDPSQQPPGGEDLEAENADDEGTDFGALLAQAKQEQADEDQADEQDDEERANEAAQKSLKNKWRGEAVAKRGFTIDLNL